jgi:hypothetical protein
MAERLERFRAALLSPAVDRRKKIQLLRSLVQYHEEEGVRQILRDAAEFPRNRRILGYIVRAYGYLKDPSLVSDLEAYVAHDDQFVVSCAVKAAAALDRTQAVQLALQAIRGANSVTGIAAAKVIAQRCAAEATPLILQMACSHRSRERYAALMYLRYLEPRQAMPIVLEMLRREKRAQLIPIMTKVLPRVARQKDAPSLAAFREELLAKAAHVEAVLAELAAAGPGDPAGSGAPDDDTGAMTIPDPRSASQELAAGQRRVDAAGAGTAPQPDFDGSDAVALASLPVDVPGVPEAGDATAGEGETEEEGATELEPAPEPPLPPAPLDDDEEDAGISLPQPLAPPPGSVAAPASASAPEVGAASAAAAAAALAPAIAIAEPEALLPWQEKERRAREKRRTETNEAVAAPGAMGRIARSRAVAGAMLAAVACVLLVWLLRPEPEPPPSRHAVESIQQCRLGALGARVKFTGNLVVVSRDYNLLQVRDDKNFLVSVYYPDQDIGSFTRGRTITVEGVIKEIRTPEAAVLQGITASQN